MQTALRRLTLRNVGPFEKVTVDLTGQMIGVVGDNGSGKTTFVEAIKTALDGEFRQYSTQRDLVRDIPGEGKAKSMSIRLDFLSGLLACSVTRSVSIVGDSTKQTAKLVITYPDKKTPPEEITAVRAVNSRMSELIGINVSVLGEYAFIKQENISAIVHSTAAERTKSLHLMWGLDRYERARVLLHNEVSALPDLQLSDTPESLKVSIANTDVAKAQVADRLHALELQLNQFDAEVVQKRIDTWERSIEYRDKQVASSTAVSGASARLLSSQQEVTDLSKDVEQLEKEEGALSPGAVIAQEALRNITAKSYQMERRKTLHSNLTAASEALTRISSEVVPDEEEIPDALVQRVEDVGGKLHTHTKFLNDLTRYRKGDGELKCPTCGQEVKDLARHQAEAQAFIDAHKAQYEADKQSLDTLQRNNQQAQIAQAAHKERLTNAMEASRRVLAEWQAAPDPGDPEEFSEAARVRYQTQVDEHSAKATELVSMRSRLSHATRAAEAAQRELQAAQQASAEVQAELDALSEGISGLTAESIASDRETLRSVSNLRVDQARLREQQSGLEREIAALNDRLLRAQQMQSKIDKITEVKDLFTGARDVLHRDNLPRLLSAKYLDSINVSLNKFLEISNAPYTVEMIDSSDGYLFECTFVDGVKREVSNLSGGQKVQFSVSFLLAVGETLGGSFGITCLDEPTASLDGSNVRHLAEVLTHVRQYAANVGSQIIVVTHHEDLLSAFDRTILIENGSARDATASLR
jgi:DNA repair exonuclease SbcCD ATPase subunit